MASYIGPRVSRGVGVLVGPGCVIGNVGFGYEKDQWGSWQRRDHPFGVKIGDAVEIGANTVIDRGRWRDTEIGAGSKIDSAVFIAHNVVIGERCIIVAGSTISGSCTLGDDVWVGPGVTFKDHVTVGDGALIGAGAVVTRDVPAYQVWAGVPARYLREVERNKVNGKVTARELRVVEGFPEHLPEYGGAA